MANRYYHSDCKPKSLQIGLFRLFDSKYQGYCQGCQSQYQPGDKIALVSDQKAGQPPAAKDGDKELRSAINQLRQDLIELRATVEYINSKVSKLTNTAPAKVPMATPADYAAAFDGTEIDAAEIEF